MLRKENIGRRVLIKIGWTSSVREYKVLELSPKEKYVKLEHIRDDYSRYTKWEDNEKVTLVDVLPDNRKYYVYNHKINWQIRDSKTHKVLILFNYENGFDPEKEAKRVCKMLNGVN